MEVDSNESESSDPVDLLYALFNKIKENQSVGKSVENGPLFDKILLKFAATSAESHVKRLSAQLICRLLPELAVTDAQQKAAFNALIDLVEDDDAQTRRQVISGLPRLCSSSAGSDRVKDSNRLDECATKVADVLVQLMQTDDDKELSLVQQSLLSVLNSNALPAIEGIFAQLGHADLPESARRRCIRFLADRLLCVDRQQMTPAVEEAIVDRVTAALDDVTELEFTCFVRVLASLQCMQTVSGRQRLFNTICSQATDAIDPTECAEFDPLDLACVGRVRGCARQALTFLSKNIVADKFVTYYLDKVVPRLGEVPELIDGDRPRLELLQQLAELTCHASTAFKATDAQLASLLASLESELPNVDDHSSISSVEYNFSHVECLLLALHQLGQARQDYLASTKFVDQFAVLKGRLQHCQAASQSYQKSLKPTDSTSSAISVALATTANVTRLIDGLLRNPPTLLLAAASAGNFTPSWLPGTQSRRRLAAPNRLPATSLTSPTKETGIGAADSSSRKRRAVVDLPTYRPPVGKFSGGVGGVTMPRSSAVQGGRSRYYNVYTGSKC